MQDFGIVMETMVRPVYHAENGLVSKILMEAIIYQQPSPVLVIMRSTSIRNATAVTGFYTVISGDTLGEWKKNMEESSSMIWKPLPQDGSGLDLSYWK